MIQNLKEEIINILMDKEYHSSKELCEELNIKSKKLKTIIEKINLSQEVCIDSRTGKGYILKTELSKNEILNIFTSNRSITPGDLILLELLFSKEYMKIEMLESKYYFSYSKIYSHVQKMKEEYDVSVSRKLGYKINIDLFKRKIHIIEILKNYIKTLNYKKEINFLFSQLGKEVDIYINQGIEIFKNDIFTLKSAVYVDCLLFYILDNIIKIDEYSKDNKLCEILHMPIDKSSEIFWGNYILKDDTENEHIDLSDVFEEIYIQRGLKFNYTQKEYEEFQRHLNSILKYNSHGAYLKNEVIVEEFSKKYAVAYEVSIVAAKYIETSLNIILNDMEKLYLAIYFQKLIYNSKSENKIKVIIVCQYGYAMSSLIAKEISSYFDDIDIYCMQSLKEFMNNEENYFNNIDIVITTVTGIEAKHTRIIYVDKFDVASSIEQIRVVKNEIVTSEFRYFIENDFEFINIDVKNRDEVYEKIQDYCLNKNLCLEEYLQTCKEREKIGNVVVGKVVYMHGNNKYILKNKILLFELDNEIEWLGEKVRYIFMLCITSEFLKKYNKQIAKVYSTVSALKIVGYKDVHKNLLTIFD